MGTLRAGLTVADPPLNGSGGGLDTDVITAVAELLGDTVEFVESVGRDTAAILGDCDCVAAVDAATPNAAHAPPYLITGQALAVDTNRFPRVRSVDDLAGLTVGVQRVGVGRSVADRLLAEGRAGRVRVYDHDRLCDVLQELKSGDCDAVVALAPVLTEAVRSLTGVEVVQRGLSADKIAIAVARSATGLLGRITAAQAELEQDGTLQRIRRKWLHNPFVDQGLAVH